MNNSRKKITFNTEYIKFNSKPEMGLMGYELIKCFCDMVSELMFTWLTSIQMTYTIFYNIKVFKNNINIQK